MTQNEWQPIVAQAYAGNWAHPNAGGSCPADGKWFKADQWNTRTDPPVAMDEVVVMMDDLRQFQDADDHILEEHARRILTRLKDSSK